MRFNHPAAATAFRAVARAFGEGVRVVPLLSSEHVEGVPDPERAAVDTFAVVALSPTVAIFDGSRQGRKLDTMTKFQQSDASVWFTPETYAAIGYALRTGDRVILVERAEPNSYLVAREPLASERGDVPVHLVEER